MLLSLNLWQIGWHYFAIYGKSGGNMLLYVANQVTLKCNLWQIVVAIRCNIKQKEGHDVVICGKSRGTALQIC